MLMVRMPIEEGSAKIRTGGPIDEPEDLGAPVWAGQIPLSIFAGEAVIDGVPPPGMVEPGYVRAYPARGTGGRPSPGGGLLSGTHPGARVVEPGG